MKDLENKSLQFVLENYRKGMFDTRKALKKISKEENPHPVRKIFMYASGLAAAVLVLVGGFLFFHTSEKLKPTCIVSEDKVVRCTLPDQTEVILAPGSSLSYLTEDFKSKSRVVKMKGKAFFSVTKNENAPFLVYGQYSATKVLGTRFQINEQRADSITEIYVESGKVYFSSLSQEDGGVVLTKGMKAMLPFTGNQPHVAEQSVLNPLAWADNTFVYESTPVMDVLEELSDFYGVTLSTPETDKKLTAEFRTDDLDNILAIVEQTLEIKIQKE